MTVTLNRRTRMILIVAVAAVVVVSGLVGAFAYGAAADRKVEAIAEKARSTNVRLDPLALAYPTADDPLHPVAAALGAKVAEEDLFQTRDGDWCARLTVKNLLARRHLDLLIRQDDGVLVVLEEPCRALALSPG